MALQKNITSSYGIDAKYWVVSRISIDRINLSADVELYGYASQEAEQGKSLPLVIKNFHIDFVENEIEKYETEGIPPQVINEEILQVFSSISEMGYNFIKLSKDFENAQDV